MISEEELKSVSVERMLKSKDKILATLFQMADPDCECWHEGKETWMEYLKEFKAELLDERLV